MKRIIIIVLSLYFISILKGKNLSQSVDSMIYDLTAPSFVKGVSCKGGNPANLYLNKKEMGIELISWIGNLYKFSLLYSTPSFKNKKIKIANAINASYIYSGDIELRDSNAVITESINYGQIFFSLISAVELKYFNLGFTFNYLSEDFNDVYQSDITFDIGVKYNFYLNQNMNFILGAVINNIMSDNNDYIMPKNIDNSIGFIYHKKDMLLGIGTGYITIADKSKIGITSFYEDKVGVKNNLKFKMRIIFSYSDYAGRSVSQIMGDTSSTLSTIKIGLNLDFGLFKINYGFQNFGIAGNINNIGIIFGL